MPGEALALTRPAPHPEREIMRNPEHEEEAIVAVLRRLEREARAGAESESPEADLEREYTELLGLLAYGNEPAEPSAAVRARLLDAVRAEAAVVPLSREPAAPPGPAAAHRSAPSRALAAAALVVGLGLAGLSAYLFASLQQERSTVLALRASLARQQQTEEPDLAGFRREIEALRAHFTLVTSPGVEICPLGPRSVEPPQPQARGHLYVSPDHRHWLLTAHGLDPCRGEQAYHVWFLTDDGPVCGGVFHVASGQRIEIGSEDMPPSTRAVFVTLEPSESTSQPSGPTVLWGDEPEMTL